MRTTLTLIVAAALASAPLTGRGARDLAQKGTDMATARGPFDVKVSPVSSEPFPDGNSMSRFTLDKQYHGELEAAARGEMLTASSPVKGSAGYVAVERVEGTLAGRRGTFMLQHLGRMGNGAQEMTITVVPDSGTGELAGLDGRLEIRFGDGGAHFYELNYTLPARP